MIYGTAGWVSQPADFHIRDNYDDDGFKAGAAVAG